MSFDFFFKLGTTEKIIFLIVLLLMFSTTLLFLRWAILQAVEFFTGTINSEGNLIIRAKQDINEIQRNHADCNLAPDFMQILQLQQIMLNKIFHIKDKETLSEQMAYIEQRVDLAANQYEKSFCELLEKNGKRDYLYSSEYISYRALIEFTREKVLTKFRHMCKENHFLDKSDEDFNDYVRNHVTLITDMIIQNSKNFFPYYLSIIGYSESLSPIKIEVKKYITESIYAARTTAINNKIKIDTLLLDFEKEYERITGLKPKRISL